LWAAGLQGTSGRGQAPALHRGNDLMKVIAIANKKGGSGKTTTSVNLAASLAQAGNRVLLCDLDAQAHSTIGLGVSPRRLDNTVHHLMNGENPDRIGECIRETVLDGLSLLPANQDFDVTAIPREEKAAHVLRDGLKCLADDFDVVIVDSPPALDLPMYNAVLAAQFLLIPFQPGFLNYEGVGQMLRILLKAASKHDHRLALLGVLPVMLNPMARMHRQILGEAITQFGQKKVFTPIRRDIKLEEAFMHGLPACCYSPHTAGSRGYVRLAANVAELIGVQAPDLAE